MRAFHDDLNKVTLEDWDQKDVIRFNNEICEVVDGVIELHGLELGVYQNLDSELKGRVVIEQRFIVKTDFFDSNYTDSDRKLGAYFEAGDTHFVLWSPTSVSVKLKLEGESIEMTRDSKGFYSHVLKGEHLGLVYSYLVNINGHVVETCDPYAKGTLPNRGASVVADMTFDKVDFNLVSDSILELHVRDFTMDPTVDFKQRGKLVGLLESHGNYGMKHILDLGMGMIQIQPLTDFETVDELNPFDAYNWGYDPMQFFALEGSYSSNISDPLQVLRDFSHVVNEYHNHGIGVSMDVVYNHIYEVEGSSLDACVPYYYFRYVDGKLSDGTFCGNEIASEFTMVRKFIVDSCVYFVEAFDIDGYRFDLMGITDIDTMNEIRRRLVEIKPNIVLYGEGWNMASGIEESIRATMQNHRELPGYRFFNDSFRDSIGGKLDGSRSGIYGSEPSALIDMYLNGSSEVFDSPDQSINYVECHDNYTIADKLALQGLGVEAARVYLEATILSKGTCFLQIGQSFFRNKLGVENSYKSSDEVNHVRWKQLDEYKELNELVKRLLVERRSLQDCIISWDGDKIVANAYK